MQNHLEQRTEWDCGVIAFSRLTGLPYEEIVQDVPKAAVVGMTVDEWIGYLSRKGFQVVRCNPTDRWAPPCAHLVAIAGGLRYHWIYQDQHGIHDPSHGLKYVHPQDPRLLNFEFYSGRILTVLVPSSGNLPHDLGNP